MGKTYCGWDWDTISVVVDALIECGAAKVKVDGKFTDLKRSVVMLRLLYGLEIGLKPIHAFESVSLIKGARFYIATDALEAVARASGMLVGIEETKPTDTSWRCVVKRVCCPDVAVEVSIQSLKKEKLWDSNEVWTKHPDDMASKTARHRALDRAFADVLFGLHPPYTVDAETGEIIPALSESDQPMEPDEEPEPYAPLDALPSSTPESGDTTPGDTPAKSKQEVIAQLMALCDKTKGGLIETTEIANHVQAVFGAGKLMKQLELNDCLFVLAHFQREQENREKDLENF